MQSDERSAFLNLTTGEVVSITDEELYAAENDALLEDFPAWQHDAIRMARCLFHMFAASSPGFSLGAPRSSVASGAGLEPGDPREALAQD